MNFLAHIYLSGSHDDVKVGNFIGDYVKGSRFNNYPKKIKKGILMHRAIDSYTDTHPVVRRSKLLVAPRYHKHAGIIVDIFYDHFLSVAWKKFSDTPLPDFIDETHEILLNNFKILPPEVQSFIHLFIEKNWMASYLTIEGIEKVLNKMAQRTSLPEETAYAIKQLRVYYSVFKNDFLEYFPQLIQYIQEKFGIKIIPDTYVQEG
ncbi:MAG: ACP phosphodiesterase [Bacteroidales bacterium]